MCLNMRMIRLESGLQVHVPCHLCWQCRADRVGNWVGKCLAEAQTSAAVDFVTLTYCDVHSPQASWVKEPVEEERYKTLHYEDVQKYLKRIRKAGHKVRYVVAGEYGERKGRAHWHILLFWQDGRPARMKKQQAKRNDPDYIYGNEWQDEFWHHGHVNYQKFDEVAARYVCKYLLKWDTFKEKTRKTCFRYSARPGIGFRWICDNWCQRHVEEQLAPQSSKYTIPGVTKRGVALKFKMSPHLQVKFVQEFERRWKEQRGGHPPPSSWCEKVLDRVAKRYTSDALELRKYVRKPDTPPPNGEPVCFDEKLNTYYFDCGGFRCLRFYWSFDDKGVRSWQRDIVPPSKAEALRAVWASGASQRHREASQATRRSSSDPRPASGLVVRPWLLPDAFVRG